MEQLIKEEIENIKNGIISDRVKEFVNHSNKYAILKDSITVTIRLTCGKEATIDITDLILKNYEK